MQSCGFLTLEVVGQPLKRVVSRIGYGPVQQVVEGPQGNPRVLCDAGQRNFSCPEAIYGFLQHVAKYATSCNTRSSTHIAINCTLERAQLLRDYESASPDGRTLIRLMAERESGKR
jgi:hypothetical protein